MLAAAAALVGAKAASVERSTAPSTYGVVETKVDLGSACGEVCNAETWCEGGCICWG